jgi:two-component system phosphate regulon response regulator PhoB
VPAAEVYRRIRLFDTAGRLPVIVVGAPPAELDVAQQPVAVLAKPCSVDDLMAAARALLDRTNPRAADAILIVSEFELDRERHRLRRGGKYIHLGPIEYRLIEYLMTHSGELLTRPQIVNGVWGNGAAVEERAVDVQLKRLRAAINSGRRKRDPIRAVRGLGYIFG